MPVPDPVAFTVFHIDIMWYAILISCGIILATVICCIRSPKHGLTSDQILNFVIICIPAGIIGARLYYVLFHWDWYAGDFFQIINIRAGGLAIHGGLIAGLGTAALLCYFWHVRPLNLLDLAAPSIALAQSIGRWGNYFNSEAHGGPTDLPWAITADGQSVHPTFLYESIWCFLLFLFLLWLDRHAKAGAPSGQNARKKKQAADPRPGFEGRIILTYGMLYSLERFFVEALRTDSLMIGPFKQAQVISLVIFLVCAACYLALRRRLTR
ncbi:MAG: prolipoprotein diacylglyceryl transferase [Firmicutes bacterium]|nr:prolipoprotein diacylglyceryl transferase [Bacillota bacterium]